MLGTLVSLVLILAFTTAIFATASQDSAASAFAFPGWFFALITFVILLSLVGQGYFIYGAVQAFQGKDFSYPLLGWL